MLTSAANSAPRQNACCCISTSKRFHLRRGEACLAHFFCCVAPTRPDCSSQSGTGIPGFRKSSSGLHARCEPSRNRRARRTRRRSFRPRPSASPQCAGVAYLHPIQVCGSLLLVNRVMVNVWLLSLVRRGELGPKKRKRFLGCPGMPRPLSACGAGDAGRRMRRPYEGWAVVMRRDDGAGGAESQRLRICEASVFRSELAAPTARPVRCNQHRGKLGRVGANAPPRREGICDSATPGDARLRDRAGSAPRTPSIAGPCGSRSPCSGDRA